MPEYIMAALIVAVGPALLGLGQFITSVRRSRVADGKLDHIIVLTNSTLTRANEQAEFLGLALDKANERIALLEAALETLMRSKDEKSQS